MNMGLMLAACLLAQSSVQAPHARLPLGALGADPVPDKSPTSWACTLETLSSGTECVFESQVQPSTDVAGQRAQNIKFAREIGPNVCAKFSRASNGDPDPQLAQLCQRQFTAAADRCSLDGQFPLVDPKGRFAAGARSCYRAMSEVLQHTTVMGLLSSQCCQCMAASHCGGSIDRCYRDLARGTRNSLNATCAAASCADECQDEFVGRPEAASMQSSQLPSIPTPKQRSVAHEL